MKTLLPIVLLAIAPIWSAEKPAENPKRKRTVRIVVVKPDLKWQAADLAGGIIGNLIGQWMMRPRGPSAFDNWNINDNSPREEVETVPGYREPVVEPIATITIESSQPDSEVLVDAKPRGLAPLSLTLPSGVRFVVVRRAGFRDWTQDVDTKPGDAVTVRAELKRIPEETFVITVQPSAPRQ